MTDGEREERVIEQGALAGGKAFGEMVKARQARGAGGALAVAESLSPELRSWALMVAAEHYMSHIETTAAAIREARPSDN